MKRAARLGMVMVAGAAALLPQWRAAAGDWPTWRCDARRSATSAEGLPDQLYPQWALQLPAPTPAWPHEPRLQFDLAYEPVVAGQTLFLGSSLDGGVTAIDAETGRQRWKFFTEGPVRFAPVAWNHRVFAGSDDGYVYSVDARDGTLLWKVRGAPGDRPDRRHLGNNRLISFWPVRGGPVLADGTLYFAAGIWPTMGVSVVALDAETGKVLWRNDRLGHIDRVRADHNNLLESGLSPQGYLVVQGPLLLVPNGRSMPAGLDRKTGTLIYYLQGYRNGDCHVTASEEVALVGQTGAIDPRTGREVASRWASAGQDAPRGFDVRKFELFESPLLPYKRFPGCSWQSALAEGVAYGLERGTFYAYDLRRTKLSEYEHRGESRMMNPWRWDAEQVWQLAVDKGNKKSLCSSVIRAGNRLYAQVGENLVAVDAPAPGAGQPRLAWSTPLKTPAASLAAADGRLFVSGADGSLICFGARETAGPTTPACKAPSPPEEKDASRWARAAREILDQSKVTDGYCVVLGAGGSAFLHELLRQLKLRCESQNLGRRPSEPAASDSSRRGLKVIAVYAESQKVNALREMLAAEGLYGTRAEVFAGDPFQFPLPPCLASLLIADDTAASAPGDPRSAERLSELLRPYGGTACIIAGAGRQATWEQWCSAAARGSILPRRAGEFLLLSRDGPLPGSASWTHESADAARSFFSKDQRVKAPLGILWYGDGPDYGFWKYKDYGSGVKPQVVGGRLFALQQHTDTLHAYDVYTGRTLWRQRVDARARHASTPQGVYVTGGSRVQVLDPATGSPIADFPLGIGAAALQAIDIRVADDVIVVTLTAAKKLKETSDDTTLVVLNRADGRALWRRAHRGFTSASLALGRNMVFCTETVAPAPAGKAAEAEKQPKPLPYTLQALDARTGQTQWSALKEGPPHRTSTLLSWLAYSQPCDLVLLGDYRRTYAFEAAGGRLVWEAVTESFRQPWILRGETLIAQTGGELEIRTGKLIRPQRLSLSHFGCNYAVGCENLMLVRDASACYVEVAGGKKQHLYAARSGCSNSLIAADGLLSVPCFSVGCVCNYPLQTSFAMVSMPEAAGCIDPAPLEQSFKPQAAEPARTDARGR